MDKIHTFRDVIDLWDKRISLARAIGVEPNVVTMMYSRDSIKAEHFDSIVQAAQDAGHKVVTHELLCKLAAKDSSPMQNGGAL